MKEKVNLVESHHVLYVDVLCAGMKAFVFYNFLFKFTAPMDYTNKSKIVCTEWKNEKYKFCQMYKRGLYNNYELRKNSPIYIIQAFTILDKYFCLTIYVVYFIL